MSHSNSKPDEAPTPLENMVANSVVGIIILAGNIIYSAFKMIFSVLLRAALR